MIESYTGINTDYVVMGLAALLLIFFIIIIVFGFKIRKINKKLKKFLKGKDGQSLEEILVNKLDQIEDIAKQNAENERNIKSINSRMKNNFCKYGIVKYDAFEESGGKLSFVLTLLDEKQDGFILNVVHSNAGSYGYIKEVISGNSILSLGKEEEESLIKALSVEENK